MLESDKPPLTIEQRLGSIEERLDDGSDRMRRMDLAIAENTEVTKAVHELMIAGKVGFKVAGWIGVVAGWVGKIALAVSAVWGVVYMATHGGQPPVK
jgi:hypothetical protein